MNHRLTDEMLQELAEDCLDGLVGSTFVKEYMRAAYDLGRKHEAELQCHKKWQEAQPFADTYDPDYYRK